MNFSGIYRQQQFWQTGETQRQNISWVEVQELPGSNCYCDEEAAKVLKEKLEKFSAEGMHFIDSGNYHYMSRIWLEKLEVPFRLVVFDNHTDMQLPAFGGLLSCGGWIAASLEEIPLLEEVILIGPDQEAFDQTEPAFRQKVQYLSREKLRTMTPEEKRAFFEKLEMDYPMYISVDKDVLCKEDASTTWSQGDMTLEELMCWLSWFSKRENVIGMDVCGESDPDTAEKDYLNDQANRQILEFWMEGRKKL